MARDLTGLRGLRGPRGAARALAVAAGVACVGAAATAGAQEELEPTSRAEVHYERGAHALRTGDVPAALEHLARAAEERPHDAGVVSLYAQALVAAGRAAEAQRVLDELAAEGQGESDLAVGIVRYQLGQHAASAEILQRAVEQEPRSALGHLYLASARIELGRFAAAEESLATAERLDPGLGAEVAFRRGHIAEARGDGEAAQRYFDRAEQLAPGTRLARRARRRVRGGDFGVRPWMAYATFGSAWDSNVNLAGQDDVLSTDREGDSLAFAELGGHYDVLDAERVHLRLGGTAFINYHEDERDFDLLTGRAWAVGALDLTEALTFDVRYTYEWIFTNFRKFRRTHAAEPSFRWRAREDLLTRAFFRFEDRDFFRETEAFPGDALPAGFEERNRTDPLDRDGQVLLPGVEQYWFFPDFTGWGRGFVRLGYSHRRENTQGSEADSSGHIGNLMVGLPLVAELFLLAEGEYEWRHYSHVSVIGLLSGEETDFRNEQVRRARLLLRRPLTERVTAELGYRWTKWTSNVDFFEFDRHNTYFLVTYRY